MNIDRDIHEYILRYDIYERYTKENEESIEESLHVCCCVCLNILQY